MTEQRVLGGSEYMQYIHVGLCMRLIAILRYVILRFVLCSVMLRHVRLSYFIPCYVMFNYVWANAQFIVGHLWQEPMPGDHYQKKHLPSISHQVSLPPFLPRLRLVLPRGITDKWLHMQQETHWAKQTKKQPTLTCKTESQTYILCPTVYTHTCIQTHKHVHKWVCMHLYKWLCMHDCTYLCLHVYMYIIFTNVLRTP